MLDLLLALLVVLIGAPLLLFGSQIADALIVIVDVVFA